MKNVCLIPAWRRPEMLWHCLQNIRRAHGAEEVFYVFRFDTGHDPDLHGVIKDFPFAHMVSVTPRTNYQLAKQSYSLLTGLQVSASQCDGEGLVYMVEEDVMVATDFFRWHQDAHSQQPVAFACIASANPNRAVEPTGDIEDYYLTSDDYCGIGVSFRPHVIGGLIAPHMATKYFSDPIRYCAENFQRSPYGMHFAEQDGLIRRIQWRMGEARPLVYPYHARCYHAGFYGKNRGAGPLGTVQDRVRRIAEIIYSDEAMRTFAKHPEWYNDSRPINLTTPPWQTLTLKALDRQKNPAAAASGASPNDTSAKRPSTR